MLVPGEVESVLIKKGSLTNNNMQKTMLLQDIINHKEFKFPNFKSKNINKSY